MTLEEKSKIYQLKKEGYGYKKIASELGISVSSVQSFLKRNPVDIDLLGTCKRCGMTIAPMDEETADLFKQLAKKMMKGIEE